MTGIIHFLHSGFNTVVPFVVLLGILIFVHELGHFLVAIWCGVRVETFSLGFGKKIVQFKRGHTTYCISLIPLGGYVKMFGDEVGSKLSPHEQKYSFNHQVVWKRIAIVLAGPMMNFFFAIFLFSIISATGEDFRAPNLGDIDSQSEAYKIGLRSGDSVLRVNGVGVETWDQIQKLLSESAQKKTRLEVRRKSTGEVESVEAVPSLQPNPNLLSTSSLIGDIQGLSFLSRASVVGVRANSLAQKWGLKTGDELTDVNGTPIHFFRDLENAFVQIQKTTISLKVVRRDLSTGDKSNLDLQINLPQVASLKSLGIESPDLYLYQVVKDSPAQKAGLMSGDRILKVNNSELKTWEDLLKAVKSYSGEGNLAVAYERDGQTLNLEVSPTFTQQLSANGAEEKRFTIGVIPWIQVAQPDLITIKAGGFTHAVQRGYQKTVDVCVMTVMGFLRLIQNKISPKNIGGVLSIGQAASETFKIGISQFIQMMAVISVNLFILNLLPIPVLDGGHLLFYVIEALRGAPLSLRKMEVAQQVGLVLLMSLMVFALFNDFSRIFGFW